MNLRTRITVSAIFAISACAVAAATISYFLWGYAFVPPGLPALVGQAVHVRSVAWVKNWGDDRPVGKLQRRGLWSDALSQVGGRSDDFPDIRGLQLWRSTGVLRDGAAELSLETATKVINHVDFLFPKGAKDYELHAISRNGIVAKFDTAKEQGLILLAMNGGQHRNDHYAYREVVLRPAGDTYEVIAKVGFEYDFAGFEWAQFPILFTIFLVILVFAGVLAWIGFLFSRGIRALWTCFSNQSVVKN